MTDALSPTQLGYIRRDGQRSRFYLAIHKPAVIFAAQVNQDFTSADTKDRVVEVTFDGVTSGAYTDILAGMTCYVGSSAGAYDLGMVRMRKAATSTKIYPGENSDVKWDDNAYLTVVDEFGIWAKFPRLLADGTVYMDYDTAYSNQHTAFKPVVVMGSDAVLWLTGASVSVGFDASDSWCLASGSKSYAWTTSGGTITGDTTATPTIAFTTVGVYRVACTVTVGGVSSTGYRHVFVYSLANPPISAGGTNSGFSLNGSPSADTERGGWEFDITLYGATADISNVRDGAQVILFSRDWYGDDELYIGAQTGRENIKCMGWIASESIVMNPVEGSASFSVRGPHYFIEKLASFIDGIESNPETPASWTSIQGLTVDKAIWHLLEWRSTVTSVLDFRRSNDTHCAKALQTSQGGLLSQIRANSEPVFASPRFDRYGRLYLEIEAQVLAVADRSGLPTVLTLTKKDWQGALHITRNTMSRESRIELSGVYYTDGTEPLAYFALAGGHVFKRWGDAITVERLLLSGQAEANERAGLILGWHNHTYDFEISTASNNGMVDIAPRQYVGVGIVSADTPRGVAFSGKMIPRRVVMEFDVSNGFVHNTWVGEEESFPENSVNGDIPPSSLLVDLDTSVPSDIDFPDLPALTGLTFPSATTPPTSSAPPKEIIIWSSDLGVMYTKNFGQNWYFMNAGLESGFYSTDISQTVVTPSGAIYIMTDGSSAAGWSRIMRADSLGATWRTVFLATQYSSTARISGLGVNPTVNDQIAIVVGDAYVSFGTLDTHKIYVGGGSSYSAGGYVRLKHAQYQKAVIFWKGNWIVSGHRPTGIGGSSAAPKFWQYSAGGGLAGDPDGVGWGSGAGATIGDCHASSGVNLILWGGNTSSDYSIIENLSGTSQTTVSSSVHFGGLQGLAVSPTSTKGMGNGGTTPYKSSDYLVTWSSMAGTVPIGSDVWENCGDDFRFLWGGGNVIRFSPDFGVTYADIESDMITIAPLIDIIGIRMVKL